MSSEAYRPCDGKNTDCDKNSNIQAIFQIPSAVDGIVGVVGIGSRGRVNIAPCNAACDLFRIWDKKVVLYDTCSLDCGLIMTVFVLEPALLGTTRRDSECQSHRDSRETK
jgi:hypothetical protein